MEFLDGLLTTLVYIVCSFILFLIGKFVYQLFNPKIKVAHQLVEEDNFAFAIAYVGYYIGLLLAIGSAVMGPSYGLVTDVIDIGIYGLLSIVLLNISLILNDKFILSKFKLKKEILEERNIGSGLSEAAIAISTGLIVLGAIHGEGYGKGGPLVTAILYWLLGQVILFITGKVYNMITPYDVHEHIEKNNLAVGIGYAGALIAIANLIRAALMHDFVSWSVTFQNVLYDVVIGLLFLPVARYLTDKILLPGQNLTDEIVNQEKPNVGAATVEAFAYIGGSILIAWSLA
ncbi:MAG TPA: DUF350 domain-containing protein [Cyclobacteriaceae bacterium]